MTEKKKTLFKRILMLVSGVLLIAAGIVSFVYPDGIIGMLPYVLGIFCVVSGGCYIIAFLFMRRSLGAGFLLADGVITVVLGALMLFNVFLTVKTLSVLISIALALIGVSLIRFSVEAKNLGVPKWWGILVAGIVLLLAGLVSIIDPVVVKIGTSILVGIMLILGGSAALFAGIMVERNKDKIITIKEKDIEFIPDERETSSPDEKEKGNGGKDD